MCGGAVIENFHERGVPLGLTLFGIALFAVAFWAGIAALVFR
jgi:hypothetical protein